MRATIFFGIAMDNIRQYMQGVGQAARAASRVMASADTNAKNRALAAIADALLANAATLAAENAKDISASMPSDT